jgi:threonylcarbamoyladenosine tRNA methylthiotransferase MtaB
MNETAKKIAFHTLGCKLNFSETSTISRKFRNGEFEQVLFSEAADIYVINSCSVTRNAEKRCKSLIKQAMKKNPQAFVAVIGCFSQINPEEIKTLPGVGIVLGNADKFNLFEHIKKLKQAGPENSPHTPETNVPEPERFEPSWSADGRTRSFFKVQDGCDYFCSYCTIPLARGHSRSDTIAATIEAATEIAGTNIRELVLSGVNIGDFGKLQNESLLDLLKGLVQVDGLQRIRISSVEPDLLHDEIIELVASQPRLMPHFHIPLQSGSDAVLKAMGRRYTTGLFKKRVEKIRSLLPLACIAADLIVGFPGETEELFAETLRFIEQTDISYVHVFTYSERDHTKALKMPGQIPVPLRHERSRILHGLSDKKKKVFYDKNKGTRARVLWEEAHTGDYQYGFTENYIKVRTRYNPALVNQIQEVDLNIMDRDMVYLV